MNTYVQYKTQNNIVSTNVGENTQNKMKTMNK